MGCLVLLLLGIVSLRELSIDLLPDVTFPTISVVTVYEGAGPEQIETLITRPMEQALASVQGVERMSSETTAGRRSASPTAAARPTSSATRSTRRT
jgi:HAE1 family hydrophobic/amphiphilic exporter-1